MYKDNIKEPFNFEYTYPCLGWYDIKKVSIKWDDFLYFHIKRRFGPSWWLIGTNPVNEPRYHWEEKELGEIGTNDLIRFIKWAKTENGSKISQINVISSNLDIFNEIKSLIN